MSILDSAELLLQAKNYSGSGAWLDESGNGHDAQLGSTSGADTNDPLFKAHDGFQYVNCPGTSGNWMVDLSQPASSTVAAEEVATLAVWFRQDTGGTFDVLFSTTGGGGTYDGVGLRSGGSSTRRPDYRIGDGTAEVNPSTTPATISLNVWHHLAVTIDHTTAVDLAIFYFDGATVGSDQDISALGELTSDQLSICAQGTSSGNYPGDIATVEMYKDIATAAEISTAFNAGVGTLLVDATSPVTVVDFSDTTIVAEPYASVTDPQSNVYTINRSSSGLVSTVVDQDMFLLTTDDYFEIADDAALDFGNTDDFSGIVIFRTNTVAAGDDVLLAKKDNLTTSLGYVLLRSTAAGKFIIADGTLDDDDTAGTIAIHTLASVGGVRNTTDDDIEAFKDGTGSGSATTDSTTTTLANAFPLRIGATSNTAASFF